MAPKILPCECKEAGTITAKSAAVKNDMKPRTEAPFHTKDKGAAYQDYLYGKGNRLHNEMRGGKGYRCSVCRRVKN